MISEAFDEQLTSIINEYDLALSESRHSDASDILTRTQVWDLRTRCVAVIERATGPNSAYRKSIASINARKDHDWNCLGNEIGVARALLSDIRNCYLTSLEEIAHGDIFGDYLEMADHLQEKGYKDAAAVLAGGTLEIHLRNLGKKGGVPITTNGRAKKSEQINSELAKKGIYKPLDQKNVTAWLALRNKAAHGKYHDYTGNQVQLLISSIRHFISRYPA